MVALLDLTPWYLVLISISIMLCLGWRSDAFIRRLSAASFPPAAGGTENMTPAHGVPPKHPPKKENPSRTLHSGTEIVIRSSFVFPQQIISPRGVEGGRSGRWICRWCGDSGLDTIAPAEPGWSCMVVIFCGTSLLLFFFGVDRLMLRDLSWHPAQIWHWNSELQKKMREKESKRI